MYHLKLFLHFPASALTRQTFLNVNDLSQDNIVADSII